MSQHVIAPPQAGTSPQTWYRALASQEGFIADQSQAAAIAKLEDLWQQLVVFKQKRNRLFGKSLLPMPDLPRGLYFWGGVGRGKSFLMDAFYAGLPFKRKKRLHFHHFMQQIHKDLRAQQGQNDPLGKVADQWARAVRVLCFDEFHVSDIADAMILGRLMEQLFDRGVVLVTTSNYPPDGLYPNGLHRASFLPTIELLKAKLDVLNVDGGQDFRLRTLTAARTYLYPNNTENEQELTELFAKMATAHDENPSIEVEGRQLTARRCAGGAIWFDFAVLCGDGRGQADYLALSQEYHTVFLSGLPKLSADQSNLARRFTWLVDVFYDNRVKLIIAADVPVEDVYVAGLQASEFFRTASRLSEMQSKEYLALAHQTLVQQVAGVVET